MVRRTFKSYRGDFPRCLRRNAERTTRYDAEARRNHRRAPRFPHFRCFLIEKSAAVGRTCSIAEKTFTFIIALERRSAIHSRSVLEKHTQVCILRPVAFGLFSLVRLHADVKFSTITNLKIPTNWRFMSEIFSMLLKCVMMAGFAA